VLDLTDDRGHFAGFLLAQLGAEVIAVEPPGGHRARGTNAHLAYDRGKASVVATTAEEVADLAADADALIECGARPVDLDALRRRNPRLVTASLSPFGARGPKAAWLGTDLTLAAASGQVSLTGDRDRAPVRISVPQVWANTGAEAACAVLIALHERARSGRGQHIDVSAQEAMMLSAQGWMAPALVGAPPVARLAGGAELFGQLRFPFVYPCRDGHVTVTFLPGVLAGRYTTRLVRWLAEEGLIDDDLAAYEWIDLLDHVTVDEAVTIVGRTAAALAATLCTRTKAELFALARERRLLLAPIATTADVLADPHFEERGFWDEVTMPDSGAGQGPGTPRRFPGPFARCAEAPLDRLGPAPRLGQHTGALRPVPRTAPSAPGPGDRPALEGVRVLDLTWVYAGPFATRMLAYYGATVVRVESATRPDQVRSAGLPRDGKGGPEDSQQWHSINADKLSLQLDLSTPEAHEVMLDLARWADVAIEGFAPGVAERLGLGHEALRAVNPRLVSVSTSLFGHTGRNSAIPGFGNMGAATAGFYEVTGWPDRLPAGPFLAYTDATSPRLTAALVLAAIDHVRVTGTGLSIDFSQIEGGLHFLAPALVDQCLVGRTARRLGNGDLRFAPHGVYPAGEQGADRWVAIACEEDGQWRALAQLVGRPDLAGLDAEARWDRRDELDALVGAWTDGQAPEELQHLLQRHGVPAHQVQNSPECVADPQLAHRDHFAEVPHPVYGHSWAEQFGFRLSRTPGRPRRAGPTWGEHNQEVLAGLLGYDDDRIAELVIAGALE
jgi:crotonobetainyl-CoA:carnitine CoA-transferase CaiB-like acyl-CoA transferase